MNKYTENRMAELLETGYELRSLEFKSPFLWSDIKSRWLKENVVKAVLGMTNTRDGGEIIIGIEEIKKGKNKELKPVGLTDNEFNSFKDYDAIKGYIDGFSYTETNFDISWGKFEKNKYIIFTVRDFDEIPAICKKDSQEKDVLKKNVIYTRSKKAPYSTIPTTDIELREIIHMAVDKEKSELKKRGWIRKSEISPEDFYKNKIKDID